MKTKMLLMAIFSALVFSCSPDSGGPREEIKDIVFVFEQKEKTIIIDDSFDLFTVLKQKNVNRESVQWYVDNLNVLSLSGSTVKGVSGGQAMVTARLKNTTYQSQMKVIVRKPQLKFTKPQHEVIVGKSYNLSNYLEYSNVAINQLNWVTSDTSVLTVDNKGTINTKREGEAKVVVYVKGTTIQAELRVIVHRDEIVDILFDTEEIEIHGMENITIPYRAVPEGASIKSTKWEVNASNRIKVVEPGVLYSDVLGSGQLTITLPNGTKIVKTVRVVSKGVRKIIAPYGKKVDLVEGQSTTFTFVLMPVGESYTDLDYKIIDNPIIRIDSEGVIHSMIGKKGIATVVVSSKQNPEVRIEMKVEVKSFTENVFIDVNMDIYKYPGDLYSGKGSISIYKMMREDVSISNFRVYDGYQRVIMSDLETYKLTHYYNVDFNNVYKPYIEFDVTFNGIKETMRLALKGQIWGPYGMVIGYE